MFFDHYKKIILSNKIADEIKIFCILELLHRENISLERAREICYGIGVFKKPPSVLEEEISNLFEDWLDVDSSRF